MIIDIVYIMKKGNHRLFLRDLQERMADVRYTQTVLNSNTQELENTAPTVCLIFLSKLFYNLSV